MGLFGRIRNQLGFSRSDIAEIDNKKTFLTSSAEGSWRGPFFGMGELDGMYQLDPIGDGWQRNLKVDHAIMQYIPSVSGGIHLHGSAGAQLRPYVNSYDSSGNVKLNTTSAASRVLINPNSYESGSEFQSRAFRYCVQHGMACIFGLRNLRYEIEQIHILEPGTWSLYVDDESREAFVLINQNGVLAKLSDASIMVPMRDVFIFKWASSRRNPLLGESPLEAAGFAASIYTALSRSQASFFKNMRRSSGVLVTEDKLTSDQMKQLRAAFDEQARSMQQGGIPILAGGLKWNPMSLTSQDAQLIESLKMSNEEIARAMGIPPPLLGQLENATLSNVEQLISHWMSISLGGLIERYERGLDRLFGLNSVKDRIEMDTTALLRTDFAERMKSYGSAIQNGVMSPNEVRRKEGLSPKDGGDDIFLQRQMTSVSLLTELNAFELENDIEEKPAAPAEPEEVVNDSEEDEKYLKLKAQLEQISDKLSALSNAPKDDQAYDDETTNLIVRDAIARAMGGDDNGE